MVVGHNESAWRHNDSGAVAGEVDHGCRQVFFARSGSVGRERRHGQVVAIRLHALVDGVGQGEESPHTLVGGGMEWCQQQRDGEDDVSREWLAWL